MKIILATGSQYRKEAFEMLGIDFITEVSDVEEYFEGRKSSPDELVIELARLKMEAVARKHKDGIIIGFDSVGYFQNQILEKPKSRDEARKRLQKMSGETHTFLTGIVMRNLGIEKELFNVVKTHVVMRALRDDEIEKYLDQDPHYNTYALGYDPLGHYSAAFIKEIKGSYNNLLRGIPLETIVEMINQIEKL